VKAHLYFRKLLELNAGPVFHKNSEVSYQRVQRDAQHFWPETTKQEDNNSKTSSYFRIKLARRSRQENFEKAFNK